MAKLIADVGPEAGKTLTYTHIDSWENHSQNWTPKMRDEFRQRRKYDLLKWLPAMTGRVVGSLEQSERFLWDLRKTVAELSDDNYARRARERAHQHGMKLSIEAYGDGLFDLLSYAGCADMPMGEFWVGGRDVDATLKIMASGGHIHGKNVIGAEAFTADTPAAKWTNTPYSIKALGDGAFCDGINRFVFHRYAMQPWLNRVPGMTMGPYGVHYERTQTWWEQTGPWHQYLARCNYLLQQGLYVADICYVQTEDTPNGYYYAPRTAYEYDLCPPEVVLTRMKFEDGRIVLPDGMSYRLLALAPSETMTPALLTKIKELIEAGATVVGAPPQKSPSLGDDPDGDSRLRQLVGELWADCDGKTVTERRFGKGKVIWGKTPQTVLAEMGVPPDFQSDITSQTATSRYIHRTADSIDIYFVSNSSSRSVDTDCTFRVKGKRPEFWHPDTERIEPVAVYEEINGVTRIPMWFDPGGSVFVVFRPDVTADDPVVLLSRNGKAVIGTSRPPCKTIVQKAVYGLLGDPARTRDVTKQVQRFVERGELSFQVARMAEDGDPAFGVVKTLSVDFTVDDNSCRVSSTDPQFITLVRQSDPPVAEVFRGDGNRLWIEASKPGRYEVNTASGKTASVDVPTLPETIDVAGPWELKFPKGWDAPKSVTLDKLISWSEHPNKGVKYFSGTAAYITTLRVPAGMIAENRRVYLDLGDVQVIAQAKLNGKDLGILWKPPFRLDVSDAIHAGDNALEIRVTNNWVNRLIGDEQLPEDAMRTPGRLYPGGHLVEWPDWLLDGKPSPTGRRTFSTWRLWFNDDPLQPSGLLGPVKVSATQRVEPAFQY
jgi:hypothetical protein